MAAGQCDDFVIEAVGLELLQNAERELGEKGHVVFRIDDQRLPRPAGELLEIRHGADGAPKRSKTLDVDLRFQAFANVARRLAVPDDVSKVCRGVIEGGDSNAGIVSGGKKRVTGTEAGADNSKAVVTLRLQLIEAATNVDGALAAGVERATDVSGDGVVGAADFGGHANVVIRHAEPQNRDAKQV